MQHECYRSGNCGDIPYNDYDVALLELSVSPDIENSYVVNKACLPKGYDRDDFVGNGNCWAAGFGDTQGMISYVHIKHATVTLYIMITYPPNMGHSRDTDITNYM